MGRKCKRSKLHMTKIVVEKIYSYFNWFYNEDKNPKSSLNDQWFLVIILITIK